MTTRHSVRDTASSNSISGVAGSANSQSKRSAVESNPDTATTTAAASSFGAIRTPSATPLAGTAITAQKMPILQGLKGPSTTALRSTSTAVQCWLGSGMTPWSKVIIGYTLTVELSRYLHSARAI